MGQYWVTIGRLSYMIVPGCSQDTQFSDIKSGYKYEIRGYGYPKTLLQAAQIIEEQTGCKIDVCFISDGAMDE